MPNAATIIRQAFVRGGTNTRTTISIALLCIFAISWGIATPIKKKQAAEPTQRQVQPIGDQASSVCTLTEGFDDISTLIGIGWVLQNKSMPLGSIGWAQGNPAIFTSQSGASNSYIDADFNNGAGAATISNWLLTPTMTLQNNGALTFWTRTPTSGAQLFPDRLQV